MVLLPRINWDSDGLRRVIEVTTQEIRRKSAIVAVSRSVPLKRYLLSLELLTYFGLLALLFRELPAGMIELAEFLNLPNLNSAMGPGIISVGLAGFGANARTTFRRVSGRTVSMQR